MIIRTKPVTFRSKLADWKGKDTSCLQEVKHFASWRDCGTVVVLTILRAYKVAPIRAFQTFESISSLLPMKTMNSISALAVPRNGSSFGPGHLGRGSLLVEDVSLRLGVSFEVVALIGLVLTSKTGACFEFGIFVAGQLGIQQRSKGCETSLGLHCRLLEL